MTTMMMNLMTQRHYNIVVEHLPSLASIPPSPGAALCLNVLYSVLHFYQYI